MSKLGAWGLVVLFWFLGIMVLTTIKINYDVPNLVYYILCFVYGFVYGWNLYRFGSYLRGQPLWGPGS